VVVTRTANVAMRLTARRGAGGGIAQGADCPTMWRTGEDESLAKCVCAY
jgi:hypothetical protein